MSKINLLFPFLALLVLSSCVKTYKLVPSESFQGDTKKKHKKVVDDNLRSVKIYDEWQTDAMFDVLWLSDETRKTYVNTYCSRRGEDSKAQSELLQKELDQNKNTISFYVLADVRDKFHPTLTDKTPAWTMYLDIDGKKVVPKKITEVELEPEILSMVVGCYAKPKYKTPYLVEFDKGSVTLNKPFKMVLSSVSRKCELGWNGGHPVLVKIIGGKGVKKGRLKNNEDWYWL